MSASAFVLDAHVASRTGTDAALRAAGIRIAGHAPADAAGIRAAAASGAVVVISVEPPLSPRTVTRIATAAPGARIVALVDEDNASLVEDTAAAGAWAVLPRSAPAEDVAAAIERVAGGERVGRVRARHRSPIRTVTRRPQRDGEAAGLLASLTPREDEMLSMLAEGLTAPVIAKQLYLSRRTVEFHLARAYRKLGVRGRIEAILTYTRLRRTARV